MIDLDHIHNLLNKQLDDGASFSQIKCYDILSERHIDWQQGRGAKIKSRPYQIWTLGTLNRGNWSIQTVHSFSELERHSSKAIRLTNQLSKSTHVKRSHKEVMISKPIRQVILQKDENLTPPPLEEVLLQMELMQKYFDDSLLFKYSDSSIIYYYWDSEHTRGGSQYLNMNLNLHQASKDADAPDFDCSLYHTSTPKKPWDFKEIQWQRDAKRLARTTKEPAFRGPDLQDMHWILSARAFAKLIQGTLGPTLCLEKPDPFNESMNPASLIETQITPKCLTLFSSPELFVQQTLLDEEGVPARKLMLIEKGVLKNFILTRFSAHHLSRSLPIHKEKILAGSARSNSNNHFHHAELRYIEVAPDQSLEKDFRLSHLYIPDLDIDQVTASGDSYVISAQNCLVNKFGGLHRRHVPRLRFNIDRKSLWSNLLGLGQEQQMVNLSSLANSKNHEAFGNFLLTMAKFRGMPCSWS